MVCKQHCVHNSEENRERWEHWINRLMQKKILVDFLHLVPRDAPRLNLKFYTRIFDYFLLDMKDYESLKTALYSFPDYQIDQVHLLEGLKNSETPKTDTILDIYFRLHDLNRDFHTAFNILVKLKDKRLFDFLRRVKIDFNLQEFLGKLLLIDSKQTVDYLLRKFGQS